MNDGWVKPERLFDGVRLRQGAGLFIKDGCVVEVGNAPAAARLLAGTLTPGFIDLQVNGGGGVLLNNTPTYAGIRHIAEAHRRFGTVAVMPTVITDAPDVLVQAASAAIAAKDDPDIIGLHIEGPHIALAKRGTHEPVFIRPLDEATMNIATKLREHGVTLKMTVAPEAAAPAQISRLVKMGVTISLGHTNADAEMIKTAIAAGATCATHLFNAMSQMTARAPNAVGAIINSEIYAGMICDGHHVSDEMIALAIRSRPLPDRTFLVSDAMATVGGPNKFTLYGQDINLHDGRLINAEGNLAGAHTTLVEGLRRLVQRIGLPLDQALRMVTSVPASAIGRSELAGLVGQRVADIIRLDDGLHFVGTLAEN